LGRRLWQCRACCKQTSLTAGPIFESTRLALRLWFLGFYHFTEPKNNVSGLGLKRRFGLSYKTAWRMKHNLLQVMGEHVEVDDAYLGGVHPGTGLPTRLSRPGSTFGAKRLFGDWRPRPERVASGSVGPILYRHGLGLFLQEAKSKIKTECYAGRE
jgi:hypothetical protein